MPLILSAGLCGFGVALVLLAYAVWRVCRRRPFLMRILQASAAAAVAFVGSCVLAFLSAMAMPDLPPQLGATFYLLAHAAPLTLLATVITLGRPEKQSPPS